MIPGARISHIDRLELSLIERPWPFARQRRGEIDAYFAAACREKPQMWNGRVLLMHERTIADGVLRGSFAETDFASFLYWRDIGFPPADAWDCFGAAAVMGAGGSFLLGEMADHTANARMIYFPCGTPDPNDVTGDKVDFTASVARELHEETGLDLEAFRAEPGWTLVEIGATQTLLKVVMAPGDIATVRAQAQGFIEAQENSELVRMHVVRSPADLSPAIPDYVQAFLLHRWR